MTPDQLSEVPRLNFMSSGKEFVHGNHPSLLLLTAVLRYGLYVTVHRSIAPAGLQGGRCLDEQSSLLCWPLRGDASCGEGMLSAKQPALADGAFASSESAVGEKPSCLHDESNVSFCAPSQSVPLDVV